MENEFIFIIYSGADPAFQVRGSALKKIVPSGGRHENFWGISCEKFPPLDPPLILLSKNSQLGMNLCLVSSAHCAAFCLGVGDCRLCVGATRLLCPSFRAGREGVVPLSRETSTLDAITSTLHLQK